MSQRSQAIRGETPMMAEIGTIDIAASEPKHIAELFQVMQERFGGRVLRISDASSRIAGAAGSTTFEIAVNPNDLDEVMDIAADIALQFEDTYNEIYSLLVVPTE